MNNELVARAAKKIVRPIFMRAPQIKYFDIDPPKVGKYFGVEARRASRGRGLVFPFASPSRERVRS